MGSEKHVKYTLASAITEEILYAIVKFIRDSGQTTIRFSNDAGTDAIYTGAGFVNAAAVASAASFGANSYMVIEPVTAMPGGERWQAKIKMDAPSADDLGVTVACTKAGYTQKWTNAAAGFHASQIKTGEVLFGTGNNPSATMSPLISAGDMDEYDQHQFDGGATTVVAYTYFRILWYDSAGAEGSKFPYGLRIGGYRPLEPHLDLNPWCVLNNKPQATNSNSFWGTRSTNTSYNNGRVPLEDAQTTLDLSATGLATLIPSDNRTTGEPALTRGGRWATSPLLVGCLTNGTIVGSLGKYDMLGCNVDRSDNTADSVSEYLCVNDIVVRWKP